MASGTAFIAASSQDIDMEKNSNLVITILMLTSIAPWVSFIPMSLGQSGCRSQERPLFKRISVIGKIPTYRES